jgi:glucosamine--fructose-6-phosphate aminotransferase (isomerizing)
MDQLLSEIMEQPAVLQRLIDLEYPTIRSIATEILRRDVHCVLIAGRGTSDNAATYAKYLFGSVNRLPVALAAPSLYTMYQTPPRLHHSLVLAISQSGMSPDVMAVIEDARAQGMYTVAITNVPDSPLARAAERVILCRAGEERSIAATKTYTAELMALALLSVALADDELRFGQLQELPEAVTAILGIRDQVFARAERYRYMTDCVVIGRGYNYATADEMALKLKELTYVGANPYSSADFMHGPIAAIAPGFPVFLVAPDGRAFEDILQLANQLRALQAELIVISDCDEALTLAHTSLRLPASVDEWLSPVTAIVPGQLFGHSLALVKGLDPDHPRSLRKVTETR